MVFDDEIVYKLAENGILTNMHMKMFMFLTIFCKVHNTFATKPVRVITNFVVMYMKIPNQYII